MLLPPTPASPFLFFFPSFLPSRHVPCRGSIRSASIQVGCLLWEVKQWLETVALELAFPSTKDLPVISLTVCKLTPLGLFWAEADTALLQWHGNEDWIYLMQQAFQGCIVKGFTSLSPVTKGSTSFHFPLPDLLPLVVPNQAPIPDRRKDKKQWWRISEY